MDEPSVEEVMTIDDISVMLDMVYHFVKKEDWEFLRNALTYNDPEGMSDVMIVTLLRTTYAWSDIIGQPWIDFRDKAQAHLEARGKPNVLKGLWTPLSGTEKEFAKLFVL